MAKVMQKPHNKGMTARLSSNPKFIIHRMGHLVHFFIHKYIGSTYIVETKSRNIANPLTSYMFHNDNKFGLMFQRMMQQTPLAHSFSLNTLQKGEMSRVVHIPYSVFKLNFKGQMCYSQRKPPDSV